MKTSLFFLATTLLAIACSTRPSKIEYGSNNGKRVSINGKLIYYEEYGTGAPLLLLSGGGMDRRIKDFEKCIPGLSEEFRVIAPDTPGQGRSEAADSMSYQLITDYMSKLIDSLKIDSVNVVGWSDGGIVGILLAEKRPDKIRRVVSVGPNNGLEGAVPAHIPLDSVKPMPVETWARNNKAVIDKYVSDLPRDWNKVLNDLNKMWYQRKYFPNSVYANIKVPVMIVLGDRDDIITEHGLEMHRLIAKSQFCVLPNTSHYVFSEKPDLINRISVDFFKGQ